MTASLVSPVAATTWEVILESLHEIQCPLGSGAECKEWLDRAALKAHLETFHPEYWPETEPYFTQVAEKIFESMRPEGDRG